MSVGKDKKRDWRAETGEEPGSQTQAWFNEKQAPSARVEEPAPAPDAPPTWRARLWPSAEEPAAPQPASTLSRAQRALMGLIAAAGLVTWLLPLLLILWLVVLLVIIGLTELMEPGHLASIAVQSSGSIITIYTLFAAALIGLPTIAIATLKERGAWPRRWPESLSATLAGFTIFGLTGLFYLMKGTFPPFFFDVVLEAVGWAWMIFLPWLCLRTIALGWRALWRWMNTLPFWSGVLTGIFAVITAVATSSWILLEVSLWRFVERQDQHAAAHLHTPFKAAGPASLSPREVIANLAPEPNRNLTPFQRCAQELSSPRVDRLGQSWTDEAIHILMSHGTDRDTAYDVAHAALLNVCEHYETQELDMIGPYYIVSVRNEARTQWRRYSREERCPSLEPYYKHSTPDFGFTLDKLIDFSKRLCKIDPIDQEILLLMAQGHTSVEIGKQLKKTPADVRKRIERARAELRALYDQEQRRAY